MEFKDWFGLFHEIDLYLKNFKRTVIANLKFDQDSVFISFPKQSQIPGRSNSVQAQNPVFLAAHTIYGDLIEGIGHGDPWGKGTVALNALKRIEDPQWKKSEEDLFKQTIKKQTANISSFMGFLFEIEIYDYLVNVANLNTDDDHDIFWIATKRKNYLEQIRSVVGEKSVNLILTLTQTHAKQLAVQILETSKKKLNCMPKFITYNGASNSGEDTADITLSCNKKQSPVSLKFTSETRVRVADHSLEEAYELLGADNIEFYLDDMEKIDNPKEKREFILESMAELAEEIDVKQFTMILNHLLTRSKNTSLAFRNYVTGKGQAGWSEAIKKDFNIRGNKLIAKDNASIQSRHNETYVVLTYKVPSGTLYGTQIFIEPIENRIRFKITNLVS